MKSNLFILALIVLLSANLFAQRKIITTSGQMFDNVKQLYSREVQPIDKKLLHERIKKYFASHNNITDLDTILFYTLVIDGKIDFGFWGQDWIVQWLEAPADLIINQAGFNCISVESDDLEVEVKLVKLNWTKEQLLNAGVKNWGYYEAEGNGFNDITAFLDNPDRTGDWVDVEGSGMQPIFGEDLWSDEGYGKNEIPIPSDRINYWQWIDMDLLGFHPTVSRGEIIGVAVKNRSNNFDADRIGLVSAIGAQITGLKFYANGRLTPGGPGVGDCGWWTRNYTFDFALAVTITGDAPPEITNVTDLQTTTSIEPREVTATITDDNPSGGPSGVASAELLYSVNEGEFQIIEMTTTGDDIYSAEIPGQNPGSEIVYKIRATDIQGNETVTPNEYYYKIFKQERPSLVIFNGKNYEGGFPFEYYFGPNCKDQEPFGSYLGFDIWSYGQVAPELLDGYQNVFEICINGPSDYNNNPVAGADVGGETIRNWLDGDPNRNYFLAGQEWLGAWNGFADLTFQEGDFAYDILGISHSYNDVSYTGSSGQELPSKLFLKEGQAANQGLINAGAENLQYDPKHELDMSNWMDAFEINSKSANVLMEVETRGIASDPIVEIKPCAIHNITANGNIVIFLAYDPLGINTNPDGDYGVNYYQWGYDEANHPFYVATQIFGIPTDVREIEDGTVPEQFILKQNYPNPFGKSTIAGNAATTIEYSIPLVKAQNIAPLPIVLNVYDVLGRKIATLVDEEQTPGTYRVNFDASNLPSGVYFYQLKAGSFVQSKKMMILR